MSGHIDPISYMMEALEKADALGQQGKYDDPRYAMYTIVAQLIAAIEGISAEVAGIGNESSAFSDVQKDLQHVDGDISKIESWYASHPGATPTQALNDPEFQKDVKAFATDAQKLQADADKYQLPYAKDGMDESQNSIDMIMKTTIGPDGSPTIGSMIAHGDMANLGLALFRGAASTDVTKSTGVFADWNTNGKAGAQGLKEVEQDYQTWITSKNQEMNLKFTGLGQDQQVGQNIINANNSATSVMINNQRAQ